MKLYHGSPRKIEILVPKKAKGTNDFQNLEAIFLTDNFLEAGLYAIGKSLKGKARFGIQSGKLVIIGKNNTPAEQGYIYEFDLPKNEIIKGTAKEDQGTYAYQKPLKTKSPKIIQREDLQEYIIYVNKKEELIKVLFCN